MPNHYTTIAICSPGYEFDVDAFNTQHAKTDFCELVMPRPECLNGIVAGKAFALGGDLDPVAIKFQSAWCAPKILDKIAAWLMDQHQFDRVHVRRLRPRRRIHIASPRNSRDQQDDERDYCLDCGMEALDESDTAG